MCNTDSHTPIVTSECMVCKSNSACSYMYCFFGFIMILCVCTKEPEVFLNRIAEALVEANEHLLIPGKNRYGANL